MKRHQFPFGQEPAPSLSEQRSTIPMDPAPEKAPKPSGMTATAPLSASRGRVYATEPLPPGLRRPVLPFRAAVQEPLREDEEQEQELSPEVKPALRTARNWPLIAAAACVVAMLIVTAVQVAVELRSVPPATSARIPPLPSAMTAPSVSSSAPLPDAPTTAPAQPSAAPSASLAPVLPRAPAPRKRPSPHGEIVDPWGSEP